MARRMFDGQVTKYLRNKIWSEEMALRRQGMLAQHGVEENTMKVDDFGIPSLSIGKVTLLLANLCTPVTWSAHFSIKWYFVMDTIRGRS